MTAVLTVFGLEIPGDVHTLDGFRAWVSTLEERGLRVHFYRGRVEVDVSPQDYRSHEPLVAAVNLGLARLAKELDLGRYFMPPSWVTHEETGLSTEPDGFLVRWESFGTRVRVNPERPTELLGRPDLVFEAVSATTVRKDLKELIEGYARAGVPEYWIADARQAEPSLRILVPGAEAAYRDAEPDPAGLVLSPTFGRCFRLRPFTNRAGLPDFELEVKAVS